jgi:archaemetzincin
MSLIALVRIGEADPALLRALGSDLEAAFGVGCRVLDGNFDPAETLHPERRQYHSTGILARLGRRIGPDVWRMVGVAAADLYIPILTFVFGEAQMGGPCAVVSYRRLEQEFYGLPADPGLLRERLLKETVHELGHTFELSHCEDYHCVMAPSHAVEWIDLKGAAFCDDCRYRMTAHEAKR